MKIQFQHGLIACLFIVGCVPAPQMGRTQGPVKQRSVSRQNIPDAPKLKRLANGHYKVTKPWIVNIEGRSWRVPAGYSSNGITAPANIKNSLGDGVDRPETWAAVFHDWLFTQKGVSRTQADNTFHKLLLAYGVSPQRASLMHTFVSAYSVSKSFR